MIVDYIWAAACIALNCQVRPYIPPADPRSEERPSFCTHAWKANLPQCKDK
jgi:hypothetical protein